EVETGAARLVREANNAMARVGVDPRSRRLSGGTRLRPKGCRKNRAEQQRIKTHDSLCSGMVKTPAPWTDRQAGNGQTRSTVFASIQRLSSALRKAISSRTTLNARAYVERSSTMGQSVAHIRRCGPNV